MIYFYDLKMARFMLGHGVPQVLFSLFKCAIYVGFWPTFIWACCCGLNVIITFLNYDIKNLIVMQKAHSNKPI